MWVCAKATPRAADAKLAVQTHERSDLKTSWARFRTFRRSPFARIVRLAHHRPSKIIYLVALSEFGIVT